MWYASIDPGKRACSIAVWNDDFELTAAAMVDGGSDPRDGQERPDIWMNTAWALRKWLKDKFPTSPLESLGLILEVPQVYAREDDKDKNDLLDLAGVLGSVRALLRPAELLWAPLPREWKGQLPKEKTQKRVEEKLSDLEKSRITWPSAKGLRHNVYDAIHMGIIFLTREGLRDFSK